MTRPTNMSESLPSRRLLMIVDPQVDFITGTLPVPGAEAAMNDLAEYITQTKGDYTLKIVTADRHPFNHFSFKDFGGRWPSHCIHDTVGAAIWPSLVNPLYLTAGDVRFFYKGQSADIEEYSIFQNQEAKERIVRIINNEGIDQIDICGLAGDVCVLNTLCDGIDLFGRDMFNVLLRFSPSLDGGNALNNILNRP